MSRIPRRIPGCQSWQASQCNRILAGAQGTGYQGQAVTPRGGFCAL